MEEIGTTQIGLQQINERSICKATMTEDNLNGEEKVTDEKDEETSKEKSRAKHYKKEKNNKKIFTKIIIIFIVIAGIIELIYGGYMIYEKYKRKFKNIDIEIGTVKEIKMENFLIDSKYKDNSHLLTNLEQINFSEVGEHKVLLSHDDREEEVVLRLVDTTPPKVEFQDLTKYIDYNPNADDFIISKEDLSEMKTTIENIPAINKFGEYNINVIVEDAYGNITNKICKLCIKWIKDSYSIERGQTLRKEDLLYNVEADGDLLDENRLKEIANSDIGDYEIVTTKDGIEIKTIIKVTDLTPPTLELKNITMYDDEKINGKDSFIVNTFDASGEVTTTLKNEINYSNIGSQEIVIEAVDKYGNKTEKTATLTIKKDTIGPVFSGLSQITIARGAGINFESGVTAKDDRDGICGFDVDKSKVNTNVAGTYYATYTSKDKKGNTTTKKRKIVVNHNQEDTENKFNEYYNNNLAGKSVLQIVETIRNGIGYNTNWGGDDPIWYGLTNRKGNCYVHALLVKKALDKKGISSIIIHTTDKTHYWNLVNEGGKYAHYDSTPGSHDIYDATDDEKFNSAGMKGRNWDRNAYPKAG